MINDMSSGKDPWALNAFIPLGELEYIVSCTHTNGLEAFSTLTSCTPQILGLFLYD